MDMPNHGVLDALPAIFMSNQYQHSGPRVCDGCGASYAPKQKHQKFCNAKCRKAAFENRKHENLVEEIRKLVSKMSRKAK